MMIATVMCDSGDNDDAAAAAAAAAAADDDDKLKPGFHSNAVACVACVA